MNDDPEAAVVRSYRSTVEAFRGLLTIAEGLVAAHRTGQIPTADDLAHIEKQLLSGKTKVEKLDVFLALWRKN